MLSKWQICVKSVKQPAAQRQPILWQMRLTGYTNSYAKGVIDRSHKNLELVSSWGLRGFGSCNLQAHSFHWITGHLLFFRFSVRMVTPSLTSACPALPVTFLCYCSALEIFSSKGKVPSSCLWGDQTWIAIAMSATAWLTYHITCLIPNLNTESVF